MPWRGHKFQSEALKIIERIAEGMDFQLAAIAGARIHFANRKAAPEAALRSRVELCRQRGQLRIVGDGGDSVSGERTRP